MTIESTGAMIGTMMCRSRWMPVAPSSSAASSTSVLTWVRPA